jgi:hypothetical protein
VGTPSFPVPVGKGGAFFFSFFASRSGYLDPAPTTVGEARMPALVVAGLQTCASSRTPPGKAESPS